MAAPAEGPAGLKHYYAAVGNREAKLDTLLELLHALHASQRRPTAICCCSRDSLDALLYALLQSSAFAVTAIHSDLTEKERELALLDFRRSAFGTHRPSGGVTAPVEGVAAASPPANAAAPARDGMGGSAGVGGGGGTGGAGLQMAAASGAEGRLGAVLAVTDVCLKALPREQLPVGVSLVVEYELPPSKEVYTRRMSALFGGGKDRRARSLVVVDLVEAGQVAAFRALEGFAASPVQELPVRVDDMFALSSS